MCGENEKGTGAARDENEKGVKYVWPTFPFLVLWVVQAALIQQLLSDPQFTHLRGA